MGKVGYIFDLSEMYVARANYRWKARKYVRLMGHMFLTGGGQPHDVTNAIRQVGIVPESVFSGRVDAASKYRGRHDHTALDASMTRLLNELVAKDGATIRQDFMRSVDALLTKHMGDPPSEFTYEGRKYTPLSFGRDRLGLDSRDYLEITSYTHHPFYRSFCLESRFNWAGANYHNMPLDEFMEIVDHALATGFTVVWNGDVSEVGFDHVAGTASLSEKAEATQKLRQATFDDHRTTVDHVMHLIGRVKSPKGVPH